MGGFLGAGKTSLVASATGWSEAPSCIANDQAPDLVDTASLQPVGPVREVAGSRFCCDFEALVTHACALRAKGEQIVFAEAVGSCTDLVATVLRPFEQRLGEIFTVALPIVVADPRRLERVVVRGAYPQRVVAGRAMRIGDLQRLWRRAAREVLYTPEAIREMDQRPGQ